MVIAKKMLQFIKFFKITLGTCALFGLFVCYQNFDAPSEKTGSRSLASTPSTGKGHLLLFKGDKGVPASSLRFYYSGRTFRFNFIDKKVEILNPAKSEWSVVSVDFDYAAQAFNFTKGHLFSVMPTDKKFIGEVYPVNGKAFSVGVEDTPSAKKFWEHIDTVKLQDFFSMVPDPAAPISPVTQAF